MEVGEALTSSSGLPGLPITTCHTGIPCQSLQLRLPGQRLIHKVPELGACHLPPWPHTGHHGVQHLHGAQHLTPEQLCPILAKSPHLLLPGPMIPLPEQSTHPDRQSQPQTEHGQR